MKIERPEKTPLEKQEIFDQLAKVSNPPALTGRVCDPSCEAVCQVCASTDCLCACTPDCPHIPAVLTDDPNFPIENKIAPLAFELKRLKVFRPCWSCEGHNDNAGKMWKVPRIWFYCDSVVYVRLLSDGLRELEIEERLEVSWLVRVTFSDNDNPLTSFAMEPETGNVSYTPLASFQKDIETITECIYDRMTEKAKALMERA